MKRGRGRERDGREYSLITQSPPRTKALITRRNCLLQYYEMSYGLNLEIQKHVSTKMSPVTAISRSARTLCETLTFRSYPPMTERGSVVLGDQVQRSPAISGFPRRPISRRSEGRGFSAVPLVAFPHEYASLFARLVPPASSLFSDRSYARRTYAKLNTRAKLVSTRGTNGRTDGRDENRATPC